VRKARKLRTLPSVPRARRSRRHHSRSAPRSRRRMRWVNHPQQRRRRGRGCVAAGRRPPGLLTCKANACDVSDTCGGVCHCDAGVPCVAGTCGGCLGLANSYCSTSGPVDGSTPGTCCGVGDECKFYGDASRCCGITGQGGCVRDTDCCDFGSGARCNLIADAGQGDSGSLPGVCQ
jgi:hypothetical protein